MKIYNEDILVRASVYTINGFSAHADQRSILRWVSGIEGLRSIHLIHGEEDKEVILRSVLTNALKIKTHIVEPEETVYLG